MLSTSLVFGVASRSGLPKSVLGGFTLCGSRPRGMARPVVRKVPGWTSHWTVGTYRVRVGIYQASALILVWAGAALMGLAGSVRSAGEPGLPAPP